MESANKMRIECNPFKKKIKYQWYVSNCNKYVDFDPENSKLASKELINTTVQNRGYEIVEVINQECNVGNVGLNIEFIGTKKDYNYFSQVLKDCYGDANIECTRDSQYYNSDDVAMEKIKDEFAKIKTILEDYKEDEISKLVDKYNDVVKPSISLCVMGLYSAGKSAFINSMIGVEILPSASDPTTAKVCKIHCDNKYEIRFKFDEKECILTFKGSTYKPNSNCDKDIIKKLQSIIETGKQHNEVFYMNRALKVLNDYRDDKNKHEISDLIEIWIPFANTTLPVNDFNFVIYDTPGSNSDSNVRHFEVLKDSLDEQTNALPIVLTKPDTMDAEDNRKILELINDTEALDNENAMVVINRADEEGPNALKEKSDKCRNRELNLAITKWKSTRIFFLSSLIAIASKKNDPDSKEEWFDADMFERYDEKKGKYLSDERKLFEFNIIDQCKTTPAKDDSNSEKSTHLYKNSGLESIEKEITEYARNYALYKKCEQASKYLQEAITLCTENVEEAKRKHTIECESTEKQFGEKEKKLIDKIKDKEKDINDYIKEYVELVEKESAAVLEESKFRNKPEAKSWLKTEWKQVKQKTKEGNFDERWAFSYIRNVVDDEYNNFYKTYSQRVNNQTAPFWDEKSKLFKESCVKIVHDGNALTDEEKKILEAVVFSAENMPAFQMHFNLMEEKDVIRHAHFLFWELKKEKLDVNECSEKLVEAVENMQRTRNARIIKTNENNCKNWAEHLRKRLEEELCTFNADLRFCKQKIEELREDIDLKKKCENMLTDSKKYIDELLDIQEGGEGNV